MHRRRESVSHFRERIHEHLILGRGVGFVVCRVGETELTGHSHLCACRGRACGHWRLGPQMPGWWAYIKYAYLHFRKYEYIKRRRAGR